MRNQLISLISVAALLTACDMADENKKVTGGFDNFPTSDSCGESNTEVSSSEADMQRDARDTVHFGFDRSDINAEAQATLMAQVDMLKKVTGGISIEGYCDPRGTTEYNLALGERRAHSVKRFFVQNGIEASRIETVSYGKDRLIDGAMTEEAYAKNRRAVTVVR
ncbi:MAG: OmpA family protein [Janthinobacterium lividum]